MRTYRYRLFGLCVESDHRLQAPMTLAPPEATPELHFRCALGTQPPAPPDLLYASPEHNRLGESVVQLYATPHGVLMRFPRVADFRLSPGEIDCRLADPDLAFMIDICLLGHVMAYYLELSGVAALHAGAVAWGGQAVLFAADRTGGKSTLVASAVAAGLALLADDIAALELRGGAVWCRPGFPQMKLTPEQAQRFAGGAEGFGLVHPSFAKLNVPAERVGSLATAPLPLARIYLVERRAEAAPDASVSIEPVAPGEALIQLVRHSFLAELLDGHAAHPGFAGMDSLHTQRFHRLAALARAVAVRRLCYPSGYQHLPAVHAAVRADLAAPGAP